MLYVPDAHGFGEPYDSFAVLTRLDGDTPLETEAVNWTITVVAADDIPSVASIAYAFDEDGVPGGLGVLLNLSDWELDQMLEGVITKLPEKGTLFTIDAHGNELPRRLESPHIETRVAAPLR